MANNIAIITARGGSKRIPKKNIKEFMGKPMLAYAIEAAIKSKIFDEIMVSTDSQEIKNVALKYGAKVPFMRSEKNSNDFATTFDVLDEVLNKYKTLGKNFDTLCCIYPCVPFLNEDILKQAYKQFKTCKAECLTPVVKYSYPIQRAFVIQNNYLKFREFINISKRSQDLEKTYHDCGMFYFYKLPIKKNLRIMPYIMDEKFVQDIDTYDDWDLAELKYKIMKNIKIFNKLGK